MQLGFQLKTAIGAVSPQKLHANCSSMRELQQQQIISFQRFLDILMCTFIGNTQKCFNYANSLHKSLVIFGDSWRTRTLGIPRSEITLEGERIITRLFSDKYVKLNFCSSAQLQHL